MINYDSERGITVRRNLKDSTSVLSVRNATAKHGGNYTCAPANARPSSVYVHVLKGKHKQFNILLVKLWHTLLLPEEVQV